MAFSFSLKHQDGKARLGKIQTGHGEIDTPVFMPVGTYGTVKTMTPEELRGIGSQIILGNAYHLHLRPGERLIEHLGGLHSFMHWGGPILTDSGGFQVYSLAKQIKISEEGVKFYSPLDGGTHRFLSPEVSVGIQESLGADIIMAFDECIPYPADREYTQKSTRRTTRWALRSKQAVKKGALFGIVQGGMFPDLREESAGALVETGFPGYALGGLSVGEEAELRQEITEHTTGFLPEDKPRYLMGVGTPCDLLHGVAAGIDMFDCVMPTRNARNGTVFTYQGKTNIKLAQYTQDGSPISGDCGCYTCRHYSKAYLRHLFKLGEILALRLLTMHNLYFYLDLMKQIRHSIAHERFERFKRKTLAQLADNYTV
ncbi:MAG: tRNA guanosine(34) transglycosylase Tgt [bacterium]